MGKVESHFCPPHGHMASPQTKPPQTPSFSFQAPPRGSVSAQSAGTAAFRQLLVHIHESMKELLMRGAVEEPSLAVFQEKGHLHFVTVEAHFAKGHLARRQNLG